MKRIACCLCAQANVALFHDYDRPERNDLYFSGRLNEYLHPVCLDATLWQIEKVYGIPAEPFRRLLNYGSIGK